MDPPHADRRTVETLLTAFLLAVFCCCCLRSSIPFIAMDEAEAYMKRTSRIRHQHFRGGYASERQKPQVPPTSPVSSSHEHVGQSLAVLPPKKTKKRQRSPSSSGEALPTAPVVLSAAPGQPRVSLLDKWFPGNTLKQATVEACHAPPTELVTATVQRVTAARETMILLRSGVEDLELLLSKLSTSGEADEQPNHHRPSLLSWQDIKRVVTRHTAPSVGEAFAQFAKERGDDVAFVRSQLREMMRRKAKVCAPRTVSAKRWHEFLNTCGPEANKAPAARCFLWLSSAHTTALFTVLVQRFLRSVRECVKRAGNAEEGDDDNDEQRGRVGAAGEAVHHCLDINDPEEREAIGEDADGDADAPPPLNPVDGRAEGQTSCVGESWLEATQPVLSRDREAAHGQVSLTKEQRRLLVFLRLFMPTTEGAVTTAQQRGGDGDGGAPRGGPRSSCGYGVWLLACLVALDIPLDPDTDRLVHELFRTCCDQVRLIGECKGVRGDQRGSLLDALRREDALPTERAWPKAFTSLDDVGTPELLALYTILIVLAKLFRQNQNRLIPL